MHGQPAATSSAATPATASCLILVSSAEACDSRLDYRCDIIYFERIRYLTRRIQTIESKFEKKKENLRFRYSLHSPALLPARRKKNGLSLGFRKQPTKGSSQKNNAKMGSPDANFSITAPLMIILAY